MYVCGCNKASQLHSWGKFILEEIPVDIWCSIILEVHMTAYTGNPMEESAMKVVFNELLLFLIVFVVMRLC